ncbi:MAG: hypothetical protein P8R35_04085 [Planctomycetota bacterium]|nr:hypothetical protein [Planctomycetota bacterium]
MNLHRINALNHLIGSVFALVLFITLMACSSAELVDDASSDELIIFSEDPFADENAEVVTAANSSEITTTDVTEGVEQSRLVEMDPALASLADEEIERLTDELRLASLQAKVLAEELSKLSVIKIDGAIQTMGDNLRVNFVTQNPFGDVVELTPSAAGLVFEFNWTIERWGALTGSDKVQRHRVFHYPDWFVLEPGESFEEFTTLPLEVEGQQGAVWIVEIDARIRCVGVTQGDKHLPVHQIDYNATRFLVLPRGWEQFSDKPLEALEQVLGVAAEEADYHVIVCCALLKSEQRNAGVQLLIDKLRAVADPHRALSITQALNWLTGQDLGSLPHVWLEWADQFNL